MIWRGTGRRMGGHRVVSIGMLVIAAGLGGLGSGPASAQIDFACSVDTNADSTVTVAWNDIGANGYDVIEDDQPKRWITTTTTTDHTPGTTYKIVAFGNGTNWTTTSCTNPNSAPGPGFSCTVTVAANRNVDSAVTIAWNDIGANGYDVIEDDQPKRWITTTTTTDHTPGTTYKIVAFGNGTNWTTTTCTNREPNPPPPVDEVVTLLAAGDIGQCGGYHVPFVGDLVGRRGDALFMPLGDLAYPDGSEEDFANCYHPFFSEAKGRTIPVAGNHEYYTAGAAGHIQYFGDSAGPSDKLYFSRDIGDWHIVVLNGECWRVGGCGITDAQYQWLQADLSANDRPCVLAAWHHAFYTSESTSGDAEHMRDYYALLDEEGADILLTGHSHGYERFHRMNAFGNVTASGIRSFVVGTGGANQRPFAFTHHGSVVRNTGTWGVLEFELGNGRYDWKFLRTTGTEFSDTGSGNC